MDITFKCVEEDDLFIAFCPELDINSYGVTKENALKRLV